MTLLPCDTSVLTPYQHVKDSLTPLPNHPSLAVSKYWLYAICQVMSRPTTLELVHAYRHLYRGVLHAVQYSKPARYVGRDTLRKAFRKGDASAFCPEKIKRTVEFLNFAAKEKGLEHKLLKSLMHTKYWRVKDQYELRRSRKRKDSPVKEHIEKTAFLHYDLTLAMLNDSMGLCLQ